MLNEEFFLEVGNSFGKRLSKHVGTRLFVTIDFFASHSLNSNHSLLKGFFNSD